METHEDDGLLVVEFVPYDDWNWELIVRAHANGFSGVSEAYFSAADLAIFAARLTDYPLDDPLAIASGFGSYDDLDDEHVRITVAQITPFGQIGVVVHLAEVRTDRPDARHDVTLELFTTYERLHRFAEEFAQGLEREAKIATLTAERMRR